MTKKVYLGGTCNGSTWREKLIPQLKMACFNPVVADWSERHQIEEVKQRAECDFLLYVISPLMSGVYSIAEAVDDSNKHPSKTVFCVLPTDENKEGERFLFSVAQIKSLSAVGTMIKANGGIWLVEFKEIAPFLNSQIGNNTQSLLLVLASKVISNHG